MTIKQVLKRKRTKRTNKISRIHKLIKRPLLVLIKKFSFNQKMVKTSSMNHRTTNLEIMISINNGSSHKVTPMGTISTKEEINTPTTILTGETAIMTEVIIKAMEALTNLITKT